MSFNHLFLDSALPDVPVIQGEHDPWLVLLSVFVSIFSATMALQTAHIARLTRNVFFRNVALATGAAALGVGIWSMHFIGMLAYELPAQVTYSSGLTVLSLVPACAASWFALRLLTRKRTSGKSLFISGTLVGVGIGAMHYIGMASMQTALEMRHDPVLFLGSIVLAIGLAIFALWVRYGLQQTPLKPLARYIVSGVVLGLAIAGMHYTGMMGVRFLGEPGLPVDGVMVSADHVALVLSSIIVTVTVMLVALNSLIRSYELNGRIRAGNSRLQATLDTAVDGIIVIDSKGVVRDYNRSAERLFGWAADEVIGCNVKMLMPEPYQSAHDGYLDNYMRTRQAKIIGHGREVVGLRKDGSHMPMRLAVGRMELPGELLFVGFVSDISDRHALEGSLRETAERAKQAAAAKSIFLANMSHEMRTPMNSIIGFSELLLQTDLSPSQRNHLGTILQSSRSLLRLINDVLDTTKMEKGKLALENIDFSMESIAMQLESSLRLAAQSKQLRLLVRYPDDMPKYFEGDPLRLMQILNNLVGNAIKFTEAGSVEVVFAYEDGIVHIQVCDTGIGMSPTQVASIFRPFTQADASISRRFGGTGLGTTIARQLATQMKGDIWVESVLGQGSTFHVRLPLPLGMPPEAQPAVQRPTALPPLRFLIADDVPQNLELLALILDQEGHTVTSAHDGAEAVEHFRRGEFDVVLMDVHMPGVDGLQATRLIRQYERKLERSPTPIVALTAGVMAEDRSAARHAGMDGFALKPIDPSALFSEIANVLEIALASRSAEERSDSAAASAPPVVDWAGGAAMWGDSVRLAGAVERFLESIDDKYPLPHDADAVMDLNTTLFSLHRLRGAAGNLALPSVAELARSMEQELRLGNEALARQRLPQLRALLQQVRQAVQSVVAHDHPAPKGSGPAFMAEAMPPDPSHLHALLQGLHGVISRNELDDAMLEAVCDALESCEEHVDAQALRSAIEAFEFRRALELIERLSAARSCPAS